MPSTRWRQKSEIRNLLKRLAHAFSIAMLLPAFGLMAFPSREAAKSVFQKEEPEKKAD